MFRIGDWGVQDHYESTAYDEHEWYSVQHWHDTDSVHGGQWWWTTGQQSTVGWRCAHCSEAVPDELKGFIKLLEWER